MKRMVIAVLAGLSVLTAAAAPASASASGFVYTGMWYKTKSACEKAWQKGQGGPLNPSLPHQCRYNKVGVYELWAYQL
ncbi:hypothetical protein [Amycolatopsis sp. PS_44_ISF1]|uniref:hypothetical protein n=1 Tax=Amycolatopsis sp. PS_44_ISF1 TaxID=2974917 RepID=UPI0037C19255